MKKSSIIVCIFGFVATLSAFPFVSCKSKSEKSSNAKNDLPPNNWNMTVGSKGDRKPVEETDPYVISVINEGKSKFVQNTFTDEKKGISLEYSLFVPENNSENNDFSKKYPIIMYIPDASAASKSAKEIVEQYFGANIWVTEEDQKKHPSFVLVPAFSVLATDDNWNTSDEIGIIKDLLDSLVETYNIDSKRIYTTGQSMGCMTSLYLNSKYPDLFAASLFVSGQWDINALSSLKNAKFFYITSGGDEKASGGQTQVMQMLEKSKTPYTFQTWNAQESSEVQNQKAEKMILEGRNANFIRFEKGSVISVSGSEKMEHNASFNYGYRISAVRDWIFEQTK